MRDLKFRAYHKKQKRMFPVYGIGKDFITEDTLDGVDPGNNCFSGEELEDIEVMQYPGHKDKNGLRICQNDICELEIEFQGKSSEFWDEPPYHHILTGVINYNNSLGYHLKIFKGFDVDNQEPLKIYPKLKNIVQYRTKVIGNIYENPELLTANSKLTTK